MLESIRGRTRYRSIPGLLTLALVKTGDPDPAELALVPDVQPDQERRDLLDDGGTLERAAVDDLDARDLLDQRGYEGLGLLIVATDETITVDLIVDRHRQCSSVVECAITWHPAG